MEEAFPDSAVEAKEVSLINVGATHRAAPCLYVIPVPLNSLLNVLFVKGKMARVGGYDGGEVIKRLKYVLWDYPKIRGKMSWHVNSALLD